MKRAMASIVFLAVALVSQGVAFAEVLFYVDPDYAGGTKVGTAANPWSVLTSTAWTTINASLTTDDVTVYFSSREAETDTDELVTANYWLQIKRVDSTAHRLTLDGMSMFNANDSAPVWQTNTGQSRLKIVGVNPIAVPNSPPIKQNYLTVRGFKAESTGFQAFYFYGGDHVVIENNDLSHAPGATVGPAFTTAYIRTTNNTEMPCVPSGPPNPHNCGFVDLTLRNNTVHDSYGECIYIGACDNLNLDCSLFNERIDQVNIVGNTVYNCGIRGAEGDGIDPHGPITNLTVEGNIIHDTTRDCIITEQAGLIKGNMLYNCGRVGIFLSECWSEAIGYRSGVIVANNLIQNTGGPTYSAKHGIYAQHGACSGTTGTDHWIDGKIYNNSVYSAGGYGIRIDGDSNWQVINNIVSRSGAAEFSASAGVLGAHDNNLYHDESGYVYQYGSTNVSADGNLAAYESNSSTLNPKLFNPSGVFRAENFWPTVGSPARLRGVVLSGAERDVRGNTRTASEIWDLGAIKCELKPVSNARTLE